VLTLVVKFILGEPYEKAIDLAFAVPVHDILTLVNVAEVTEGPPIVVIEDAVGRANVTSPTLPANPPSTTAE
jgi:hypothetical protein